jgi:hypothetical protein
MRSLSVLPVSGKLYPLNKGGQGSSEGLDWGDRGALASQPAFSSQGGMQMAASDQTIREVLRIIRKHVNQPTLEKIMDELLDVPVRRGPTPRPSSESEPSRESGGQFRVLHPAALVDGSGADARARVASAPLGAIRAGLFL